MRRHQNRDEIEATRTMTKPTITCPTSSGEIIQPTFSTNSTKCRLFACCLPILGLSSSSSPQLVTYFICWSLIATMSEEGKDVSSCISCLPLITGAYLPDHRLHPTRRWLRRIAPNQSRRQLRDPLTLTMNLKNPGLFLPLNQLELRRMLPKLRRRCLLAH